MPCASTSVSSSLLWAFHSGYICDYIKVGQRHLHIKTRISNGGQGPDGNLRFPRVNHNEMVYAFITTSKIKTSQVFLPLSPSLILWHFTPKIKLGAGLLQKYVKKYQARNKIGWFIPAMILQLDCFCDLCHKPDLNMVNLHRVPSDNDIHPLHSYIHFHVKHSFIEGNLFWIYLAYQCAMSVQ